MPNGVPWCNPARETLYPSIESIQSRFSRPYIVTPPFNVLSKAAGYTLKSISMVRNHPALLAFSKAFGRTLYIGTYHLMFLSRMPVPPLVVFFISTFHLTLTCPLPSPQPGVDHLVRVELYSWLSTFPIRIHSFMLVRHIFSLPVKFHYSFIINLPQ